MLPFWNLAIWSRHHRGHMTPPCCSPFLTLGNSERRRRPKWRSFITELLFCKPRKRRHWNESKRLEQRHNKCSSIKSIRRRTPRREKTRGLTTWIGLEIKCLRRKSLIKILKLKCKLWLMGRDLMLKWCKSSLKNSKRYKINRKSNISEELRRKDLSSKLWVRQVKSSTSNIWWTD